MTRDPFDAAAFALTGSAHGESLTGEGPPLTLLGQARLVGGYAWVERRLFEVLGSWVESEALPEAQLLFDVYSQQHAWHAELFAERVPVVDALDPETMNIPPTLAVDKMLTELAGNAAAAGGHPSGRRPGGGTLIRLIGLSRVVLPRLVTGYSFHLRRAGTVSDAPLVRSLRFVVRDLVEEWQAVEALAQTLLRRPNDVAVVTAHQEHLESLVAEQGPGLVPWPGSDDVSEGTAREESVGADLDGATSAVQAEPVSVGGDVGTVSQVSEAWTGWGDDRRS